MDTGTGLTILGSAVGSTKLLEKILGPTADYIGEGLKNWTQRRVQNVGAILKCASRKLGDRIEEAGQVPARVLADILNEGSYLDNELAAEYFGYILAASRSEHALDDRVHYYLRLVSNLSGYQIRTHYVMYMVLKKLLDGHSDYDLGSLNRCLKTPVYVPMTEYAKAMALEEGTPWLQILTHAIHGIGKENLIVVDETAWGEREFLVGHYPDEASVILEDGVVFIPSGEGAELMLWAQGLPDNDTDTFFCKDVVFDKLRSIAFPEMAT